MRHISRLCFSLMIALAFICAGSTADAQFGKLKDKIKKKTEEKIDEKVDETIDDALEGGEEEETQEETSEAESTTSSSSEPAPGDTDESAATTTNVKPGTGAWLNYDFVPGDRILYYEDFESSPVGDFPERLDFIEGNMEVAEWNGRRFLRMGTNAHFEVPLPNVLPDRFTIEFDMYLPSGLMKVYCPADDGKSVSAHTLVRFGHSEASVEGSGGGKAHLAMRDGRWEEIVHCRIMGYKKYLKVYVNETRAANVPNADFVRGNRVHFYLYNFSQDGILLDHIRIAEGGKTILYDELAANGRVATQGIYFDVNSDNIRPESTPTLKEMGKMLTDHPDLKLVIEGHTDNQGDEAYNQELSEKRAAAVKTFLCNEYGIAEDRLQSKGFGESNPADSNDTPEGRQNNRRVELVKI